MKELLSYLFDLIGKWTAKMIRANPKAFLTGIGFCVVLGALAYVGVQVAQDKVQVAVKLSSDHNGAASRIEDLKPNAPVPQGSPTPSSTGPGSRKEDGGPEGKGTTLRITRPLEGAIVTQTVEVRAETPYKGWNHYLVVTPSTGGDFVQDEILKASLGELVGQATIGSAGVGAGQRFVLRVFATKTILPNTPAQVPEDAVFSLPITVYRR